jgi:hypothetical protein
MVVSISTLENEITSWLKTCCTPNLKPVEKADTKASSLQELRAITILDRASPTPTIKLSYDL